MNCLTHPDDVGAALALVCAASALCVMGLNVQKRALSGERSVLLWSGGLGLLAGGAACLYAASAYAQTIFVSVVLCMGLVLFNLALAPLVNREAVDPQSLRRTIIALCGCILTASTAAKCEGHKTASGQGATTFGALAGVTIGLCLLALAFDAWRPGKWPRVLRVVFPTLAGVLFAASSVTARAISMESALSPMAALIAGLSCLGFAALSLALQRDPALAVVPLFACAAVAFSVVGGALVSSEFSALSGMDDALFIMGIVLQFTACVDTVHADYKPVVQQDPEAGLT